MNGWIVKIIGRETELVIGDREDAAERLAEICSDRYPCAGTHNTSIRGPFPVQWMSGDLPPIASLPGYKES